MHQSEKWKGSRSVVSDSVRPQGLQPTRLLCPWDFPGKSTPIQCFRQVVYLVKVCPMLWLWLTYTKEHIFVFLIRNSNVTVSPVFRFAKAGNPVWNICLRPRTRLMKLLQSEYSILLSTLQSDLWWNLWSEWTQGLAFFERRWEPLAERAIATHSSVLVHSSATAAENPLRKHRPITRKHILSVGVYQARREPTKTA